MGDFILGAKKKLGKARKILRKSWSTGWQNGNEPGASNSIRLKFTFENRAGRLAKGGSANNIKHRKKGGKSRPDDNCRLRFT